MFGAAVSIRVAIRCEGCGTTANWPAMMLRCGFDCGHSMSGMRYHKEEAIHVWECFSRQRVCVVWLSSVKDAVLWHRGCGINSVATSVLGAAPQRIGHPCWWVWCQLKWPSLWGCGTTKNWPPMHVWGCGIDSSGHPLRGMRYHGELASHDVAVWL